MGAALLWFLTACPPAFAQCPDGTPPPCRAAAPARPGALPLDSHVIAVLPFRVAGADSTLAEGLAELLAVEFTGQGVPRSADMGTVLRAWRGAGGGARVPLDLPSARRLAQRVGAGRLLTASVVGVGSRLSLSAQVMTTSDGAIRVRAGPVQGTLDSLPDLLRSLAAQLFALPGGERSAISGVPTEALRAFIAGRAAYRRSDWVEAARLFERALELDSTFAHAALGRVQSDGWTVLPPTDMGRINRLLWTYRDRLDPVGRAIATARLGARYPLPAHAAEAIAAKVAVTQLAPDNADAWFELGDELMHRGDLIGPGGMARARAALERALELDPMFSEAALHLSTLGSMTGDAALTRRYAPLALRLATDADYRMALQYELAIAEGRGRRFSDSLIGQIDRLSTNFLAYFNLYQVSAAPDTLVIGTSLIERMRRAASPAARAGLAQWRAHWELNRGRPRAADSLLRLPETGDGAVRQRAGAAMFAGGDAASGAEAVRAWPAAAAGDTAARQRDRCVLGQWAAHTGDLATAARHVDSLAALSRTDRDIAAWCGPVLAATVAVLGRRADAATLLARADSLVALGMASALGWEGLALGRLHAALGDHRAAVRAVRRVDWYFGTRTGAGVYLAERLRAEGQWAGAAGDTATAVSAYRRYLHLRAFPEPALMPQRDSVRAALARLEGR